MTGPNSNPFDDGYWDDFADVKVSYDPKPIPIRNFDYCATHRGYEPGEPIGYGATKQAALDELREADEAFSQEFDILRKQRELKP